MYEALVEVSMHEEHPIVIETDSLLVVQALQSRHRYYLEVGSTLEACQDILRSRINFTVSDVKKLANREAHVMARVLCLLDSYKSFKTPPHCVLETLMYDFFFGN